MNSDWPNQHDIFLLSGFANVMLLFVGVHPCHTAVYVAFPLVFLKTVFPADYDLAELVWLLSGPRFQKTVFPADCDLAELKYIHSEKVFCFFLITFVKLKGTCHETYHMIAKVDSILLVQFGGVW